MEKENHNLELKHAIVKTRYEEEIKSSAEKLIVIQEAKEQLSKEFSLLANQIFEDKSKQFNHVHKEQFEMLLKPFREQITNFSTQSKEQFNVESKDRHLLKDELYRLKEMNAKLSQDALNLTNALKGENKTQGNWGEIILERILEESGLRAGSEYETQATLKSEEGKIYRPDVIIHMPQERDIIIDSKVSLVAYERFMNEENPHAKTQALKEHLISVSGHIKNLSEKRYEKLLGVNTLDYVLLFMPIEGAFMLALQEDGEFFKRAYESNILVVSPSTLLVTLRTIEHIWRTQRQQDHANKIAYEAEAMYDKLVLFVEELQKVGTHMQKAQDSYNASMKRLNSGNGNIIKRAQNIVELGVRPKKLLSIKTEEESCN
ncbi:MAG: DNA recombination protein RmuC [Epsilonproteobacteria bacterium]|nr:DNA recombination protein RmuC [Campylobacterota bacterium]PIP11545.1 MAG: DNA recombination protein RmuC [Sulfurimonas sp. CG23_combo_of_CG06-09_8_20_14_all_36_33]PIS25501.1 MAG: DNA recombination protein RmuC [Sulfurimonas sp. CG08_land_8_20_14_0_20_36_33]PIU35657.1 MAG: DNA recombination protein RmuC [Sulfurimonas sp. CG07_land_8_20_14_0_80_36_56]PIV05236.1 MAG: DNA recombination protein RmuC [Sulfurimonas sp. CG03_land_8_20_14_0_80_36_25]PIV36126.1 MAG: DNA recombination protein RmuC [S